MNCSLEVPDNIAISFFKNHVKGIETSNTYHARCPVCGDSATNKIKKRLYLLKKTRTWIVFCHNCGYSRNLLYFVKDFFPIYYDRMVKESLGNFFFKPKNDKKDKINALVDHLTRKINSKLKKNINPVKKYIKQYCISLSNKNCLTEYKNIISLQIKNLQKRRLSNDFIKTLYYATDDKYKDRVIIPFYNKEKEPYFFQAMATKQWQKSNKYINWVIKDKSEKPLYNEQFVNINKTVYIIEGLFDSIFIDNSVATTGVTLSKERIKKITQKYPKRIWILDNDKAGISKTKFLFEKNETCILFPKKYKKIKDLNELAILLKKDNLTKIIKTYAYNGIEGLIELTRS